MQQRGCYSPYLQLPSIGISLKKTMKLQFLPMGARFEFEGKIYTKTGPLTAVAESGGQRMIPRHAVLRPLEYVAPPEPKKERSLNEAAVRAAFQRFVNRTGRLVDSGGKLELEAAAQAFWDELK